MSNIISHVGFSTTAKNGDLGHLEESLRRIVDLGADVAELALFGEDLISGGRVIEGRARRLAEICAKFDIRYTVHGLIVSNFMDETHLAYQKAAVRAMLELCERVGADVLVHHCGQAPIGPRPLLAKYDAMERDALAEMAEAAAKIGVRIALENIFAVADTEYRQTPSELAETIRAVDHPSLVGLIDFSHAYIETTRIGADFRDEVRAMAPVTGHLHVHDSFGRPYTMSKFYYTSEAIALGIGDLHLPIGWGDIPWEPIFDEIDVLPGTALIMEIGERFEAERAECLVRARDLAERVNRRLSDVDA
ncbi:myo-inositol catabolism protein [Kaistia algarum]|uniref:sugar phosphate isomerase/epimerase family protein n=1 Tax=Kaistia algarum TaxID=2083279 RepID=UPI000CE8686E|nr:TIM barrel protein [Kaistia algarum]MCX5513604.1 TIM barrel protein [Kaistia algarum]PPE79511.1 myo-inositol catabolism protein [Kaistia algarum]